MRFSPHTEDWKLTLVQISERCRLTWHEHDQWKMTPLSWPVSSVRKAVRRTELTLSLSSVYFGWWFKIIFLSLTLELFCRWIENCFSSVNVVLFLCEFKIRNERVEFFLHGFLSLSMISSPQATGVGLLLEQYSQLVQFLHSHDRHASSCLAAVPAFKIIYFFSR